MAPPAAMLAPEQPPAGPTEQRKIISLTVRVTEKEVAVIDSLAHYWSEKPGMRVPIELAPGVGIDERSRSELIRFAVAFLKMVTLLDVNERRYGHVGQ